MSKKIKQWFSFIPWYVRNIYSVTILIFFVWMIFFNRYNVLYHFRVNQELNELEEQKKYYQSEIQGVKELKEELFSTDEKKEKFARENYWMKKENEDIFIIVEE